MSDRNIDFSPVAHAELLYRSYYFLFYQRQTAFAAGGFDV